MSKDFYDKVARKFGNYQTGARITKEFPHGNPEEVFKEKLLQATGKDKKVLDVGCADGRFTLSIAGHFGKVIAIDTSKGMLNSAIKRQQETHISNVEFIEQDVHKMRYSEIFDLVYNRRGPIDYPLFYKALKINCLYMEVDIGEKDTQALKETFGRGQNYGGWNKSELKEDKQEITTAGFSILFAQDYLYNEFYKTYADLDLFLQGVPIFEDYDSVEDRKNLEKYVKEYKTDKGIKLQRHRVVIVAKKLLS
ncbi:MAG: class I SAM-dependent methyltransferase [Candidatus Levybacteria bacterium]|nr:class I SAM-dependent methyltransferase [Candidatus Levybacteria bacterium]